MIKDLFVSKPCDLLVYWNKMCLIHVSPKDTAKPFDLFSTFYIVVNVIFMSWLQSICLIFSTFSYFYTWIKGKMRNRYSNYKTYIFKYTIQYIYKASSYSK